MTGRRTPPPTTGSIVTRLLALAASPGPPALRSRAELARRLRPAERPGLDAALALMQAERQVLAVRQGQRTYYLFAGPLRTWLDGHREQLSLDEAYRRLVRDSGGFPDVKISALRAVLDPAAGSTLSDELSARWRRGEATLSLGDWSLANEETRAAAVDLHGEKYLLVRLEN